MRATRSVQRPRYATSSAAISSLLMSTIQCEILNASQFEPHHQHAARFSRSGLAVARNIQNARLRNKRDVEICGLFGLADTGGQKDKRRAGTRAGYAYVLTPGGCPFEGMSRCQ